jgi:uncharacterized protein YjiS (DUF1127 family)
MSAIIGTPAKEGSRTLSRISRPIAAVKAWWMAYLTRRIERAAIMQLRALSDRVLLDIGFTRSQIEEAVKAQHVQGDGTHQSEKGPFTDPASLPAVTIDR